MESLLFLGEDVTVGGITFYQYTIKEVFEFDKEHGKNRFNVTVYPSSLIPIDLFDRKSINKSDIAELHMMDLLPRVDEKLIDRYLKMLNLSTKLSWSYDKNINEFLCYENNEVLRINKDNYDIVMAAIRLLFNINRYDPYEKYGDYEKAGKETKAAIDMIIEQEMNEDKEQDITLLSIVEGVSCNNDSGVNIFTVRDLTVYQLFRIYKRLEIKIVHDNTMRGLYCGMMDGNKIKFNEISWVKKL